MRWLLALALLAPTASAGVAFEIELSDGPGDVVAPRGERVPHASADILGFTSTVMDNGVVRQRVELAARPSAPEDAILVRNWFHDSTNGTFWVVDFEVRGDALLSEERFRPFVRRGDFHNVTRIDARYGLDNTSWIFEFNASLVADATCFDPFVYTEHTPRRGSGEPKGFDALSAPPPRRCATAPEPPPILPPALVAGVPTAQAPPGSADTPAGGAFAALALGAALARRRRES